MTKLWFLKPAALSACIAGAFFVACSSSSSTPAGNDNGGDGGGTGTTTQGQCANPSLKLAFSPMYSAFDGTHTFQVPVIVSGLTGTNVTWSASDTTMVAIAPDPTTGGAMLTTQKAGTVDIIASAGGLCGKSTLTITATTAAQWDTGNTRYNNGNVINIGGGGGGRPDAAAGGDAGPSTQEAACTNCHGESATNLPLKTVSHTPEQTGGFSDQEMIDIFTKGTAPNNGADITLIPYNVWTRIHQWQMTPDEVNGVLAYLRALTPAAQSGSINFGQRDGGPRPPRDAGPPADDAGPAPDASAPADASSHD